MNRDTSRSLLRMRHKVLSRKKVLITAVVFGSLLLLLLSAVFLPQPAVVEKHVVLRPPNKTPPATEAERYLRCVGERLLVDAESRWVGDNSGPDVLPMMVVPLMLDLPDFRELVCNISVPVRLMVLVQNGEEPELTAFLQSLLDAYGWSNRLVVRRHPENVGYSGAVNEGLRLALTLPRETVPFVFITNSDVAFSPDLLPRLLRDVHKLTRNDAARIDALTAEVQGEPNEFKPRGRRAKVLRSPYGNSSLSTSALLPDRIRYAPPHQRRTAFAQHYGIFCISASKGCYSSVILSRLAISTVGLFDENFFPCYVEDPDYEQRRTMLGFKRFYVDYGAFLHGIGLNFRLAVNRSTTLGNILLRTFRVRPMRLYSMIKWNTSDAGAGSFHEPFNGSVPLDVWVRDDKLLNQVREYARSSSEKQPNISYNTELLQL